MASAQVVETLVTNNSPSQDSYHPDDLFQSRLLHLAMHKTSLPHYRSQMKLDSPSWLKKGKLHHGIREFPACNQLPKA